MAWTYPGNSLVQLSIDRYLDWAKVRSSVVRSAAHSAHEEALTLSAFVEKLYQFSELQLDPRTAPGAYVTLDESGDMLHLSFRASPYTAYYKLDEANQTAELIVFLRDGDEPEFLHQLESSDQRPG